LVQEGKKTSSSTKAAEDVIKSKKVWSEKKKDNKPVKRGKKKVEKR